MKKLLFLIPAIALAILITGCGYKPGTVKNEVYTNKTFGITITPPEGMLFKEVPFIDSPLILTEKNIIPME